MQAIRQATRKTFERTLSVQTSTQRAMHGQRRMLRLPTYRVHQPMNRLVAHPKSQMIQKRKMTSKKLNFVIC